MGRPTLGFGHNETPDHSTVHSFYNNPGGSGGSAAMGGPGDPPVKKAPAKVPASAPAAPAVPQPVIDSPGVAKPDSHDPNDPTSEYYDPFFAPTKRRHPAAEESSDSTSTTDSEESGEPSGGPAGEPGESPRLPVQQPRGQRVPSVGDEAPPPQPRRKVNIPDRYKSGIR